MSQTRSRKRPMASVASSIRCRARSWSLDLDVLLPLDGPVEDFVDHRGFSHSLFLLALVSPLVAWLITRIHVDSRERFRPEEREAGVGSHL